MEPRRLLKAEESVSILSKQTKSLKVMFNGEKGPLPAPGIEPGIRQNLKKWRYPELSVARVAAAAAVVEVVEVEPRVLASLVADADVAADGFRLHWSRPSNAGQPNPRSGSPEGKMTILDRNKTEP